MIERLAERLLRRHVVRRAEHEAAGREPPALGVVHALAEDRDPEIDDARDLRSVLVVLDDHVLGLEVAVHEALLVRVVQALEELPGDVDHARRGQRRLLDDDPEVGALGQLHHHVVDAGRRLADVDDADHVGVTQAAGEIGLAVEPLGDPGVREQRGVEHLDREPALELDVPRAVDRAHRARAEERLDPVALGEHLAEQRIGGRVGLLRLELRLLARHQNRPTALTETPSAPGVTTTPVVLPEVTYSTAVAMPAPSAVR